MIQSGKKSQRGLALIECLAALALVGLAVLIASSVLAAHPRAVDRLQAHQEMLSAVEATIEAVRAGHCELRSGPVSGLPVEGRAAVAPRTSRAGVRVRLEVAAIKPAGLFVVSATARCTVRGQELTRELETMVWRRPS